MVEELISTLSKEIRTSITEDTSVPRNVRTNVVTGLETYLLNEKMILIYNEFTLQFLYLRNKLMTVTFLSMPELDFLNLSETLRK